ncbi:MAG: DUF1569 domain-containing protein [Spirosomataceae bacterium]
MATSLMELTTIQEVVKRINQLSEQSPRQWGKMTVGQMLTHCADQIRICYEEKPAGVFGNNITQAIAKFLVTKMGMKMPKNIRTLPELDPNKDLMTQPSNFEQDRLQLVALVERFFDLPSNRTYTHPLLGSAQKSDIGILIYVHLDHHLRQFGV